MPIFIWTFFLSSYALRAADSIPTVQVEKLQPIELFDEFTFPARVSSRVKGTVTSEIDGVVMSVAAQLGQKVQRGATLFTIKNTDPVYEYVPVKVASPVTGVVSTIDVAEGAIVSKSQKIGTVVDPSQVVIEIEIPSSELSLFKKGLKGSFLQGETVKVPVVLHGVSPMVDPVTGTASAQLMPLAATIPIGVVGRVMFRTNVRKSLQLPEHALMVRGQETFVRVVKDSKALFVPVKVGATRKGLSEITSGVNAGDTVVISTSRYVADGQEVTIHQSDVAKQ